MGLLDVKNSGYVPKENQEFGNKKKLVGDAVCQVTLDKKLSKKGVEWIILKAEAIHTIPDTKGRDITVEPGDSIDKVYDPSNQESLQDLLDDLFTAGVTYEDAPTEEMLFSNIKQATDGKLFYYRTWANDKKAEDMAKKPDGPSYWQNIKILSHNKVTAENSVPQIHF